jgi:catechol 2,3-dioxygenase-like lactoylglutathione lyase family enzyme
MFKYHHTALTTNDLERQQYFYENLGFNVSFRWFSDDNSIKLIFLDLDGFLLEILYFKDNIPNKNITNDSEITQRTIGLGHIALQVQNIQVAKEKLVQLDLIHTDTEILQAGEYFKHFFLRDPDNNLIEIIEDQFHTSKNG